MRAAPLFRWGLILANLALLVLFPMAWFAPLLKSGLALPFMGLSENSVISALQAIWQTDVYLALLMTFFAIFAPYIKIIGLALLHFGLMSGRMLTALSFIGKLAMADIFLIALYIVLYTDIEIAGVRAEVSISWGTYLFSGCVIASMVISALSRRILPDDG